MSYDLELIRRKVAKAYRNWGYTTPTDILLMTAEQIAAAARRAYPGEPVSVTDLTGDHGGYGPAGITVIGDREHSYRVAIQTMPEGVRGHNSGPGRNRLIAEWNDPQFAEKVAAGITALGQPYGFAPFLGDWPEAEVIDFGPLFAAWMEEAWS